MDICDASQFMQNQSKGKQSGNLKFKKNIRSLSCNPIQAEPQLFVEEDNKQLFKGLNYSTTQSDLHKLIKHLKTNLVPADQNMHKYFTGNSD